VQLVVSGTGTQSQQEVLGLALAARPGTSLCVLVELS
jgi:hypothetical protein